MSANLVINGDFEQGNTGFSSQYTYLVADGTQYTGPGNTYGLPKNPRSDFTNGYISFGDHTSGSGYMLLIDGNQGGVGQFWSETLNLQANTGYSFSYWTTSPEVADPHQPVIKAFLGSVALDNGYTIPTTPSNTPPVWHQMTDTFVTSAAGPYTISLVDTTPESGGNDAVFDDFSLIAGPQPDLFVSAAFLDKTAAKPGATINVSYQIRNQGSANAAASTSQVYLSTDATITTSDTLLGSLNDGALVSGTGISESLNVTLPGNLSSGRYYIGVIADAVDQIGESDETNNVSSAMPLLIITNPAARNDFNSDAVSDIAFQNTDSTVAIWDMNGANIATNGAAAIASPGTQWHLVGSGDFYADGTADLLLQNSQNGLLAYWGIKQGSSGPVLDSNETTQLVYSAGPTWHAAVTGDFNADGFSDIAFQNDDGSVAVWEMNGTQVVNNGASILANPGTAWHLRGAGDFYGDGTSDLLLQKDDGSLAIWGIDQSAQGPVLDGPQSVQLSASLYPGPNWVAKGTGDFNADGHSDIVLQNTQSGDVAVWEMNGASLASPTSAAVVAQPGLNWLVKAVGDYNGDGMSDILLQNSQSGALATWFMNGTSLLPQSTQLAANPGTTWSPVG
jgi:hypothetical protein